MMTWVDIKMFHGLVLLSTRVQYPVFGGFVFFLTMPAIYCIVYLRYGIHKLINTDVNQVVDNDTELGGSVDSIKGGEALQRDLDEWERWAATDCRNFNKNMCQTLLLGI